MAGDLPDGKLPRLPVFIGYDPRDAMAFEVARFSLIEHTTMPVRIVPLVDWKLRADGIFWRGYHVDNNGQKYDTRDGSPFSTEFSYTRFAVPEICRRMNWRGPAVFVDADVLFRRDIEEIAPFDIVESPYALYCVQHEYKPPEGQKALGAQTRYARKNWSSVVVWNMRHPAHDFLTLYQLNNAHRDLLHGFRWLADADIGALDEAWNWLDGWSSDSIDPALVHFTRGTPDMKGYENVAYADEWRATLARRATQKFNPNPIGVLENG